MNRSRNWNRNLPPLQTEKSNLNSDPRMNYNSLSSSPQPPRTANRRNVIPLRNSGNVGPDAVYRYLLENPNFVEDFVLSEVDLEIVEQWLFVKIQTGKSKRSTENQSSIRAAMPKMEFEYESRWKIVMESEKQELLKEIIKNVQEKGNALYLIREMGECIASAVNADGFNLYLKSNESDDLYHISNDEKETISNLMQSQNSLAAFVAKTKTTIRTSTPNDDPRFPDGVAINRNKAKFVLCQPALQNDGEILGVLEFYRSSNQFEFSKGDEQIGHRYQVWCGLTLFFIQMYRNILSQKLNNGFLLNIIKAIFQEMGSMDSLVMKIMNFTQKLVKADRASLFLLDVKSKELYARIFDMKKDTDSPNNGTPEFKEIRFPLGTGLAGIAAQTGEILICPDAYKDERFNREIDIRTGYKTRNVLCMPIFMRGNVIGVMQMVNKENGEFNQEDIDSFQTFASYCGLALHHAKLYDKIRRSEHRFKIALEMLAYHNACSEEEVSLIKSLPHVTPAKPDMDSFYFTSAGLDENDKIAQSVFMFQDLFGLNKFDLDCLIRFSLTVKKNYRRVQYHNWNHGFTVANSGYAILKKTTHLFSQMEAIALFIGCLCHDLDHRGKTNKFMLDTESSLAAIYTTSTLEHHHFNQTMAILQQDDLNILKSLSSVEYKAVLSDIRHCILATDLALFFGYKAQIQDLIEKKTFDWDNTEHRLLAKAIAMTAADLCASTKPWEKQLETAKVIFEEFYDQGDAERAAGREPIAMMDRKRTDFQPSAQVGFLKGICIPCYSLLQRIIPETEPMLIGCQKNLERWQDMASKIQL